MAPDGAFKPYDFRVDLRGIPDHPYFEERHEVKHDLESAKTGNVAIEYACNGKPSGIMTTLADVWDIVVGQKIYVIERHVLLIDTCQAIFRNAPTLRKGGDGGRARINLIPVKELYKLTRETLTL